MADLHPYRAGDDLAAALRAHHAERQVWNAKVAAWDESHPDRRLLFRKSGFSMDRKAVGFTDGKPKEDPPAGLSRAQTRIELVPKRSKAGRRWQDVLNEMNAACPRVEPIFDRFGVPSSRWVGQSISATRYAIAGEHGVIVVNRYDLATDGGGFREAEGDPLVHLTPMPLSEFYAIKEALDDTKVTS